MEVNGVVKPTSKEALYHLDRMLECETKNIQNAKISEQNKKLILEHRDNVLGNGRTIHRAVFYMKRLKKICLIADKDLDQFTKKDVEMVMAQLNRSNYSKWYIEDFKSTFKVYFRYHNKLGKNDPAPELVRWIERRQPKKVIEEIINTKGTLKGQKLYVLVM